MAFLAGCEEKPPPARAKLTGKQIFAAICSRCHGTEGLGGPPTEAGPGPRRFRDLEFQKTRSDEDIARTIHTGKGIGMPPFGNTFDDQQIKDLIQEVRSFRPKDKEDARDH
ncbi:MAG: hypothetical protein JWM74_444 [Myxococcaceae bacterium]|nr:hypothetical protein [Myxococcaceae bacterium]